MTTLIEKDLQFEFPTGWLASKFDEWEFYRAIQKLTPKGMDFVALSPSNELHFIEVKDYRHPEHEEIPLNKLPSEIAGKCLGTSAGIFLARLKASNSEEKSFAVKASKADSIHVTFHVMLPKQRGRLSNPQQVLILLRSKIRQTILNVDPHLKVGIESRGWIVTDRAFHPR